MDNLAQVQEFLAAALRMCKSENPNLLAIATQAQQAANLLHRMDGINYAHTTVISEFAKIKQGTKH